MKSSLKGGGTEKREGKKEILKKKGGKLDQGVGALKRGTGIPLGTMPNLNTLHKLCMYLYVVHASCFSSL